MADPYEPRWSVSGAELIGGGPNRRFHRLSAEAESTRERSHDACNPCNGGQWLKGDGLVPMLRRQQTSNTGLNMDWPHDNNETVPRWALLWTFNADSIPGCVPSSAKRFRQRLRFRTKSVVRVFSSVDALEGTIALPAFQTMFLRRSAGLFSWHTIGRGPSKKLLAKLLFVFRGRY